MKPEKWFFPAVLLVCLGLTTYFFAFHKEEISQSLILLQSLGIFGNVLYVILFVVAGLPFSFGSIFLAIVGGYIWGPLQGFVTIFVASIFSSTVSYWLTALFFRNCFISHVNQNTLFRAIVSNLNENGFKITVLLRLTPIPFGVQNGILSMSNIAFLPYTIGTLIGVIPEVGMVVYWGSTAKELSSAMSGNLEHGYVQMLLIQIIIALFLTGVLFYLGKQALTATMPQEYDEMTRKNDLPRGRQYNPQPFWC